MTVLIKDLILTIRLEHWKQHLPIGPLLQGRGHCAAPRAHTPPPSHVREMTSASLPGRQGDRHRETKKLGGGHTESGRASRAQSSHWCTMQKARETSTFLVFACLVNGYSFAHRQNAKVTCKYKRGSGSSAVSSSLSGWPFSPSHLLLGRTDIKEGLSYIQHCFVLKASITNAGDMSSLHF